MHPKWRIATFFLCAGLVVTTRATEEGLVLYFPFDAEEGPSVADRSGNGNNGEAVGTRFHVEGCRGGAYEFNGSDTYIRVPASPSLHITEQLTLSAFFLVYDYADQRPIMSWVSRDPYKCGVQMWLHVRGYQWRGLGAGAHLLGADGSESRLERVISFADPPPNRWHHMMITYDRATGTGKLFLNGTLVKEQAMGSYELLTAPDLFIGAGFINGPNSPLPCFHGLIDEVRVYNRVVTPPEMIAMLRDSRLGREVPAAQFAIADGQSSLDGRRTGEAEESVSGSAPATHGGMTELGQVSSPARYEVAMIGFSNDPQGDEDVTEFYRGETMYVRVKDVDLEAAATNAGVRLLMYQERVPPVEWDLTFRTNGVFGGSMTLDAFGLGRVYVSVVGWSPRGVILRKDTEIYINP